MLRVIDLLQLLSKVRLQNQHQKFMKWNEGAEIVINDHTFNYISKAEKSCHVFKW